jgi:hypothetical protein
LTTFAAKPGPGHFDHGLASAVLDVGGMDPGLVIVLVLFVPLLLLAFTSRTQWSLLPGILVIVGACVTFGLIEPVHDDIGGMGALANGVLTLAAIGLSIYGVILLAVGAKLYRKPERRQPTTLPAATVVAGVDRD